MNVVYLFCASDVIRVPIFNDPNLIYRLNAGAQGRGFWDKEKQEFIFRRNTGAKGKNYGAGGTDCDAGGIYCGANGMDYGANRIDCGAQLLCKAAAVPCVFVVEGSPAILQIFNFWERGWGKSTESGSGGAVLQEERSSFSENHPVQDSSCHFANGMDCGANEMDCGANGTDCSANGKDCGAKSSVFSIQLPAAEKLSEYWESRLEKELRSRKYSPRTQKSYIYYNRLICRSLQKTPEELCSDDVTEFIAFLEKEKDSSSAAMNLALSAIKFFFKNVLKRDDICDCHRPRQDKNLPVVLSKEEIQKILGMEKNPKHRLLLMLVYSSGLRVSEVTALKKENIDLSRKVIYIKLGKGRKDRSTILSEKAALFIEDYYVSFGIEKWLFPGQNPARPLSIRSAQKIFDKALRCAAINKKISIHGLRHTFATHILENGIDIRYIQALLGHASLRTTERYTRVARRNVLSIQSPLDTIL